MSGDMVKAAADAKAYREAVARWRAANGTVGRVYTDATMAAEKAAEEARRQKAKDAENERLRREMDADTARRKARGEQVWQQHEARIQAAQDRVVQAEAALDRARAAAWEAENGVRDLFNDLNKLRGWQDFTQDVIGAGASAVGVGATIAGTGGLGLFVVLAGVGVANDLARPGLTNMGGPVNKNVLDASQGLFNDAVGEYAEQSGKQLFERIGGGVTGRFAGGVIGAGDLIKDLKEFGDPAELYQLRWSELASSRDIQGLRDLFAKSDPRGLAERVFGPRKAEIDQRLKSWQDSLRDKEKAEADLANRERELAKARGLRHSEYSAVVHGGR